MVKTEKQQSEAKLSPCVICGEEAEFLCHIAEKDIKVFGRIPISDIVRIWCDKGYATTDPVCPDCIAK